MAKQPKKKKELNEEALALCKSLRVAMALDKGTNCVTHGGKLIACTSAGTIYAPFTIEIATAFKAADLLNALDGCDSPYTISEDLSKSTLKVSWGRRTATLKTMPKVSVFAQPIDPIANADISEGFKEALGDFVNDLLSRENDVSSTVVMYDGYEAYWTNRSVAAKFQSATWLPPILMFVSDLKKVTSLDGKIVGIGGTAHSVTFHYEDQTAIKITLADDSAISYPRDAIKGLFAPDVLETSYPLTESFLDALQYVHKFAETYIYISPEHVGTSENPSVGTAVQCAEIPLTLIFLSDTVRLGAFRGADEIVKYGGAKPIGFATRKNGVTFLFVKIKDK